MTTLYVGPGGSDANNGLSWANRRLTLNGIEDKPVVAGDTVYVGPGVYRETLTVDVAGSSGNPITYIADVTGEHTDGIGGYAFLARMMTSLQSGLTASTCQMLVLSVPFGAFNSTVTQAIISTCSPAAATSLLRTASFYHVLRALQRA